MIYGRVRHFGYVSGPIQSGAAGYSSSMLYLASQSPRRAELLTRLGKHSHGRSCLYIKRLADVDEGVLEELVAASLA